MANDRRIGFAVVAIFAGLVLRFWHPVYGFTEFLQLDAANRDVKIAAWRGLPIYVYPGTEGYDGAYYAQIAAHPLLRAPELRRAIDNLAYRARRILPSALTWILGGGDAGRIARIYPLIDVFAWVVLAALLWRLLAVGGGRSWLAWVGILFSAGALSCVRLALPDLAALTLIVAAMLARESGRARGAAGWLAGACLARETSLLALAGLSPRPGRPDGSAHGRGEWLRLTLIAVLPLALWLAYIRWQVGPADQGWDNFSWPLTSFAAKWRDALAALHSPGDQALAWTTLLALVGLTAQAAYLVIHCEVRDPWWRLGGAYVVLMLFLGTAVWAGDPGAATRVLLPMTLAFNVLACRRGARHAWLLAGNLTVAAGLLAMFTVPADAREVAASRSGGIASIARAGAGWYNVEHSARHSWTWSGGAAEVDVESWPRTARTLAVEFTSRSLTLRQLTVTEGGTVLWQGPVGPEYKKIGFPFSVRDGRAALEFSTDRPATATGEGSSERALAYNIRDLRIGPPDGR